MLQAASYFWHQKMNRIISDTMSPVQYVTYLGSFLFKVHSNYTLKCWTVFLINVSLLNQKIMENNQTSIRLRLKPNYIISRWKKNSRKKRKEKKVSRFSVLRNKRKQLKKQEESKIITEGQQELIKYLISKIGCMKLRENIMVSIRVFVINLIQNMSTP